ncbi:hypothetical protein [Emticicia sp. 17c]|uniref:hypothetical protein n=1 Tax=Emticicia sp. 17c TaxID=3127704 RepID=UPI00301CFEA0
MKNLWVFCISLLLFSACEKQGLDVSPVSDFDNLQTVGTIKNKEGFLMKASPELTVIVAQGDSDDFDPLSCVANPSERYVVGNLPAELKDKTDLKIIFSGEIKQNSSANLALYSGIPLKLTKIRVR